MKLKGHIAASLPLGAIWYLAGNEPMPALLAALTSILIDVDHLPDYIYWRRSRASLGDFFKTNHNHQVPIIIICLHA